MSGVIRRACEIDDFGRVRETAGIWLAEMGYVMVVTHGVFYGRPM